MAKRAWQIEEQVDDDGGVISAYEQVADLVASLLDSLRTIGGQIGVASLRQDTGEKVGGVKVYATVGYVVSWTDAVPGMRPAPAPEPPEADELDASAGEEE
jgi:hypothetical protein